MEGWSRLLRLALMIFVIGLCSGHPHSPEREHGYGTLNRNKRSDRGAQTARRWRRGLPEGNRALCPPSTGTQPAIRVNTTQRLSDLRQKMAAHLSKAVHAYIIPMADQHQSEYVSDYDKRVEYISGFSGSQGTAVVIRQGGAGLPELSALWTDGRYFLQADDELDCNWILMREGQDDVPSISAWLVDELPANSVVGADPKMISYDKWINYKTDLSKHNIELLEMSNNLVDEIWTQGRPAPPNGDLLVLGMEFAGLSWQDKVKNLQTTMSEKAVDVVPVTALDETAWLYNMRGEDVKYNPVFVSYALIDRTHSTLYLKNPTKLLDAQSVRDHLNVQADGTCGQDGGVCVQVKAYDDFYTDLSSLADKASKVWLSPISSYAMYAALNTTDAVRTQKAHIEISPIAIPKARKNDVEIAGMKTSHKRDSAALIEFVSMLEREVKEGKYWDEISAATKLEEVRRSQQNNKGLSFGTISAVGKNGAVIHYSPRNDTNRRITTSEMYLLDSGGQYLDGTTDVTRTFHFGTPSDYEKEAYTRVLMGAINLALAIWPSGTYGRDIDALARAPLWRVGMEYRHGTGHGLGAFLNVHEGPARIAIGYRGSAYEQPLYSGMFFSDEPGFYEDREGDDNFGVRLETIVMVKVVETEHKFGGNDYMGFEEFTLVPFEKNLIKYDLLSERQRQWLNDYNTRCRKEIADVFFKDNGKTEAYNWVYERTEQITAPSTDTNSAPCSLLNFNIFIVILTVSIHSWINRLS